MHLFQIEMFIYPFYMRYSYILYIWEVHISCVYETYTSLWDWDVHIACVYETYTSLWDWDVHTSCVYEMLIYPVYMSRMHLFEIEMFISLVLWLFFVFFTGERKMCSITCDFFCSRFLIGSSKGHDPDFLEILVPFKYFLQL